MKIPYYTIAALPTTKTRLRNFFADEGDGPGWLLTASPRFRTAGFDLSTSGYGTLVDGQYWESSSGDRKRVRLYQDGTFIFRARADSGFLGWGQSPEDFAQLPALNPVAVVEVHAAFCTIYSLLLQHLSSPSPQIRVELAFANAVIGTAPLRLPKYYPGGIRSVFSPKSYQISSIDAADSTLLEFEKVRQSPNGAAYDLLVKFYNLFDADPDLIPFTTVSEFGPEVDLRQLKAL